MIDGIVHPELMHFDLRRPYREWPESVRKLIAERKAAEQASTTEAKR